MTRKEYAAQAPDYFWRLYPAMEFEDGETGDVMNLVAAMIDEGQAGAADRFTATSKDGQTVTLISPFPLTDKEKGTVRESVARRPLERWLNKWATFVMPRWFSEGLDFGDYIRGIA